MNVDDFKPGDRVRLVHCSDAYTLLVPGNEGVVQRVGHRPEPHVDVRWDRGSLLAMLPDEGDRIEKVES